MKGNKKTKKVWKRYARQLKLERTGRGGSHFVFRRKFDRYQVQVRASYQETKSHDLLTLKKLIFLSHLESQFASHQQHNYRLQQNAEILEWIVSLLCEASLITSKPGGGVYPIAIASDLKKGCSFRKGKNAWSETFLHRLEVAVLGGPEAAVRSICCPHSVFKNRFRIWFNTSGYALLSDSTRLSTNFILTLSICFPKNAISCQPKSLNRAIPKDTLFSLAINGLSVELNFWYLILTMGP